MAPFFLGSPFWGVVRTANAKGGLAPRPPPTHLGNEILSPQITDYLHAVAGVSTSIRGETRSLCEGLGPGHGDAMALA